jgi:hypothetical protein
MPMLPAKYAEVCKPMRSWRQPILGPKFQTQKLARSRLERLLGGETGFVSGPPVAPLLAAFEFLASNLNQRGLGFHSRGWIVIIQ